MSRDLTPKELDYMQRNNNMSNITDDLMIYFNGETFPAYSDEQKEISHRYAKLGMFGFDFLMQCKKLRILTSERGKEIIQQIEDSFSNNGTIEDKELAEMTKQWYEGQLVSGSDMTYNNIEFAEYIRDKIKGEEANE